MSMNFLAEGVCGIFNARCYKRDLHHVPLDNIPSIELLTVHHDVKHMIPITQETRNLYSDDKFSWNEGVSVALTQDLNETG